MHIIKPMLMALCALSLAGCLPEKQESSQSETRAEPISIATLGSSQWATPTEMTDPNVVRADDILAANNMIVLDMSGSMERSGCSGSHPDRAAAAKDALLTWIGANADGNVGLVAFSAEAELKLWHGLGSGEAHARQVVSTIKGLTAGGGTPLSAAIEMAEANLKEQFIKQNGSGTYRLIVITDGEASRGFDPTGAVREIARNPANPIELHTIGFCINGRHSLKDPQSVFYTDANSPEDLIQGLNATQGEATDFNAGDMTFEEITQ